MLLLTCSPAAAFLLLLTFIRVYLIEQWNQNPIEPTEKPNVRLSSVIEQNRTTILPRVRLWNQSNKIERNPTQSDSIFDDKITQE